MAPRLCKIALTAASFVFLLLVVFNNVTDYGSNLMFVQHVLSMDTTFPGNSGMWRAISVPAVWHTFYVVIILWEAVACMLIGWGSRRLWQQRRASAADWQRSKSMAIVGLTVSLLQWYVAFVSVGGEWFLMWQSKIWNGQDAAFRMFAIIGVCLVFLALKDGEISEA